MTRMALVRYETNEPAYGAAVAAQLAGVSLSFLRRCVREGLVTPRVMPGGAWDFRGEIFVAWRVSVACERIWRWTWRRSRWCYICAAR